MHGSWDWKHGHQSRGWSPWMGFALLFVVFIVFSKGFFWPLLILFGFMMWSKGGGSHMWGSCGSDEKHKNDEKRKNDDFHTEHKRKSSDDDTEPIYYL